MSARTRLAKAVYWLSTALYRVKTPHPTRVLVSTNPTAFGRVQWWWLPCATSGRLLELSSRSDPTHWDHWAIDHNHKCRPTSCPDCGGQVCHDEAQEAA
jgi:hypothetical protein